MHQQVQGCHHCHHNQSKHLKYHHKDVNQDFRGLRKNGGKVGPPPTFGGQRNQPTAGGGDTG